MTQNLNEYPYVLLASAPYHLRTVKIASRQEVVDFFYKYKRDSENLHKGTVSAKNFKLEGSGFLAKYRLPDYFKGRHYRTEATQDSNLVIKMFPKLCWLADSYFQHGFQYPVCIHYNPRIQENVMHPGSSRNHIINLFHKNADIETFYFNTGGVQFDFMKNMTIINKENLAEYPNFHMNVVLDHCSTIPHINPELGSGAVNIPIWQSKIRDKFMNPNFKIYMGNRVTLLEKWATNDETCPVRIYISNVRDHDDIVRAAILVAIGKSYTSPTLTVIT